MTFRQILLATTATASVSIMTAAAHAGASPRPPEMRGSHACEGVQVCAGGNGSGWYISVLGGANWAETQENYRFAAGSAPQGAYYAYQDHEPDTGFVVGGAIGRDLCCWIPGLRGEVELTYRRNSILGYHEDGTDNLASTNEVPDVTGPLDGHVSSFALMANVWYDFDLGAGFKPYVGGGVGWARSQFKINYFDTTFSDTYAALDETDSGFAYQLGVGFNYAFSQGARFGVGYRYIDLGSFETTIPWAHASVNSVTFDQQHHSAMVNLSFDID
jgi:opacity protein-like surface antigen